ncbi:cysteine--tRNA ligase [Carnobacteriaceae bacterium zg-ZUI252]|nr:cysteine--tRNA ligase [Carnobacteriaceae bacterium zg-ZUI252]
MIQFYNTLTNQKEPFKPLVDNQVSMYVCGPTVYNYIHIGNARSTVAFDVVRRYLEYRGYTVNYVSNFTDVDDKIIRAANEMEISPREVADRFIHAFYEDTAALNVKKATLNPRVMDSIDDIIAFIQVLIDKGFAYVVDGDVYFKTRHFEQYGQLSGQSIDDLIAGASQRVDDDTAQKHDPLDFALWKSAKENEIHWHSPWGCGRPGWHIECSVMATKFLGDTIDIHAGGHDLTFPHHENEIAQSQAKTGKPFANYWLHNGFVTFDGEKMSKSLGNFVLVHDLIQQVDPQVVRFLLATAHYRKPLEFKEDIIAEATVNLEKFKATLRQIQFRLNTAVTDMCVSDETMLETMRTQENAFKEAMDDDINAPNGMKVLYELLRDINVYTQRETVNASVLGIVKTRLLAMCDVFGMVLEEEETLLDEDIVSLIEERTQARLIKDFKRSDEIRDYLKSQGIILDDTPQGTRYKRV